MSLNVCVENIFYNLLLMQVLCALTSSAVKINEYVIDQGKNLTLGCDNNSPVMWIREGKKEDGFQEIQPDGSITLTNITPNDEGLYTCSKIISSSEIDSNNQTYSSSNFNDNVNVSTLISSDTESVVEVVKSNVIVRTTPGPVSKFTVRTTTIIGVIVWEIFPNRTATGGYPIRDFTAEMRRMPVNESDNPMWERLDPHHISPNARQLEIYHLFPNTTYQFRIWANNHLGAGESMTITGQTSPDILEKDLLRRIMVDAENFDTRVWIVAVGVVLGTLVILSLGTCIVLYKECHEPAEIEEELDSLELVPNIILNPGFCDSDDGDGRIPSPIITRFLPYQQQLRPPQESDNEDDYSDDDLDGEDQMTFSRRMSIFFTGNTIKRI